MDITNHCYYKAYNERYKIIHEKNHTWATEAPTPIVMEMLRKYGIPKHAPVLEIGCGEGRDSIAVLKESYCLTASDVSEEAIRYCKKRFPDFKNCFVVVDACQDALHKEYDFIFAAAVLHMLVNDEDRQAFLKFFHDHLSASGKALILTMGDGAAEFSTDANTAYEMQERTNNAGNIPVIVPNTSCRMVSFNTLERELADCGLLVLESGITQSLPDFNSLMYAVVSKKCKIPIYGGVLVNRLIPKTGAAIVTISVLLFALCLIVDFSNGSYFVCFFLPIGYIMMSAGFQNESKKEDKVAANIGMVFAAIYAVLIFLVYFAQMTSVRLEKLSEQTIKIMDFKRGGLFFNYDLLGYGMMALSTFFIGLTVKGTERKDKCLKSLMMIHGIFFIGCFIMPMTGAFLGMADGNTSNAGVIALVLWCIYFLPVGILSFLYFDPKKR